MIHNGDRLRALTVPNLPSYRLVSVDGRFVQLVDWDFLSPLVENSLVCGRGSEKVVKKYEMLVETTEADRILGESASKTRRERAQLPLDTLHRMCADRKTTFRERMEVWRGGRIVHVDLIQHKTSARMRFRGEAA